MLWWSVVTQTTRCSTWFGGEDLLLGRPWYHEELTLASALHDGWSTGAAADLAWHARRIDDYLYNPLWRLRGGSSRRLAARLVGPLLKNLHFDDLSTNSEVVRLWQRYTSGTVAAVLFAWSRDDVPAARNAIGVALHAMQDFYSHSTWVDEPARRGIPWPELALETRSVQRLWTGSFESAPAAGRRPHGALGIGPAWPHRTGAPAQHPARLLGVPWLAYLVRFEPGIALDTRWQSRVGVRERGLAEISGDELFAVALRLARATGAAWLRQLREVMDRVGATDFWRRVSQTERCAPARRRQYEDLTKLPFAFAAYGSYPPEEKEDGDDTYLRLLLRSAPADMRTGIQVRVSSQGQLWTPGCRDAGASRLRSAGLHLLGPGAAPVDLIEVRAPRPWVLQSADVCTFSRGDCVSVADHRPGRLDRALSANEWFAIPLRATEPVRARLSF